MKKKTHEEYVEELAIKNPVIENITILIESCIFKFDKIILYPFGGITIYNEDWIFYTGEKVNWLLCVKPITNWKIF